MKKRTFDLETLVKEVNQLRKRHKILVDYQRMALDDIRKLVELEKKRHFYPGDKS